MAEGAVQVFVHHLNQLVDAVGNPSPYRLAKVSERLRGQLRCSTVDDHLQGRRKRIMPWRMVRDLLFACRDIAKEDGFVWELSLLGTELEWQNTWDAARHGHVVAQAPVRVAELGSYHFRAPSSAISTPTPQPPADEKQVAPTQSTAQEPTVLDEPKPKLIPPVVSTELATRTNRGLGARPKERPSSSGLHVLYIPDLGEGGEGWATITNWRYELGDRVLRGEPLVELNTDMGMTFELSVPVSGVLEEIYSDYGLIAANGPLCAIRREPDA